MNVLALQGVFNSDYWLESRKCNILKAIIRTNDRRGKVMTNSNRQINLSKEAQDIMDQLAEPILMGELRKMAKAIKKDHNLALELWSTAQFQARLLAILIMDKNSLSEEDLDTLCSDMEDDSYPKRTQLIDWLMTNHLTKDNKKKAILNSWKDSPLKLQRRAYWYYQGRLRWTGKVPIDNTEELVATVEESILDEVEEVQWAMNFVMGWIGVYQPEYRERCVGIGERTGLYKGDHVSKGCTPNYLPEFIAIEAAKRDL